MDNIFSRFLSATVLEELPYVEGHCGEKELCRRQDIAVFLVGPSFFKNFTFSDHLYQALLGTTMKLDMADATLPVVRPTSIELVWLLANVHTNILLLLTPVFGALSPCSLMPLLDRQPSLYRCRASMRLVRLYNLLPRQRLISTGSQTGLGSLTMTRWASWRCVLIVVIFFLAVLFVIILHLACTVNDVV
jgi:hypothetical protein